MKVEELSVVENRGKKSSVEVHGRRDGGSPSLSCFVCCCSVCCSSFFPFGTCGEGGELEDEGENEDEEGIRRKKQLREGWNEEVRNMIERENERKGEGGEG